MINLIQLSTIFFDPLEQFELSFYQWSIFNSFTFLLLFNIVILISFFICTRFTNIFTFFINSLLEFFKSIFFNILGLKHQGFFYFYFYLFIFIFLNNLVGMVAYTYTLTSFFLITFFFSFSLVGGTLFIALEKNRFVFFGYFYPKGVPVLILYLLVFIELISYVIRLFSLAIRLFANMVAGHALLKILLSFIWVGLTTVSIFSGVSLVFWSLICVITLLEILIAFLQAYVFVFLGLIYLSEVL